ncbi:MAG: hypothetical protein C4543_11125 [Ignavibacteriales bacterium]|jgi:hypothetical protein|nr:MAG: hypothetical protein C4543_11125 [Ignavibacteriales bacterium]
MKKEKYFIQLFLFIIFLLTLTATIYSQPDSLKKYSTSLNADYQAGSMHRFLFGDNWRSFWTDTIDIPIVNIYDHFLKIKVDTTESGKSYLSLISNDHKGYKFSLLEDISSDVLPEGLEKIYADNFLNDQLSGINPFAKIISSNLLKAVNVYQTNPRLVILSEGKLQSQIDFKFFNKPGILEENFKANDNPSTNLVSTLEVLNKIEADPLSAVNAIEFFKIRLIDLLLGNWNRSTMGWQWQLKQDNYKSVWHPISSDRITTISKFDGLGTMGVEFLVPQVKSFGKNISSIDPHYDPEIHLDKRLLTQISKQKWDSLTTFIQESLSDFVITNSVNSVMGENFVEEKSEIINLLKIRRDKLKSASEDYYEVINKVAIIYGSQKDDYVLVERLSDSTTSVSIFGDDFSGQLPAVNLIFKKIFSNEITDEIRIFMLDGDDNCLVTGEVDCGLPIRIIGGEGNDVFADNSKVNGYFLSITPLKDAETKTLFYDSEGKNSFIAGSSTSIDETFWRYEEMNIHKNLESQSDFGSRVVLLPDAGYSTFEGVILGGNISLYSYNFRKIPYEYLQRISFLYGFALKRFNLEYFGEFIDVIGKTDFVIDIKMNELSFTNYFGFGNNNEYNSDLFRSNYYKLNQELFLINPQLKINLNRHSDIKAGVFYEYTKTNLLTPTLINSFRFDDYGTGELQSFGANLIFQIDSRDNIYYTTVGDYVNISGKYFTESFELNDEFFQLKYDIRKYLTFNYPILSTIALRASGGKNWGRYPFFNAIFLGGDDNLRGFTRERFSGDAAVSFQSELRTKLMDNKIIVKGEAGIHLFAEVGRVFTSTQTSTKWHPSFGGGLWTSFLERDLVFTLSYGRSNDEHNFYFDTQMAF